MIKASIYITRTNEPSSGDEKITISETEDSRDLFKVVYKTPEFRARKAFVTTESRVLDYVEDILESLQHDTDPFEYIQVDTIIHPPILYHISDLDEKGIRKLILGMIQTAMRMDVESE